MSETSDTPTDDTNQDTNTAPDTVAIEGKLPLTAIDIESQKDMMSGRYHPLRSLHKWFAARPTPAARLAVLASAYPDSIGSDELLRLMQVGPDGLDSGRAEYVEEKFNEDKSSNDSVDDHYGYPNPNTQTPANDELDKLHDTLRDAWGGEMPTVLDPTAGRGIIPFEAMRYGFPVVANELNPIPTLISKVALEYAPDVGSVTPEIYEWRDKIHETAKQNIEQYYPPEEDNREILNSAFTYLIECGSCGGEIPLVMKWWLNKTSAGGDAVIPQYEDGEVSYKHVKVQNAPDGYDPNDGPVSRGDAECPHCSVVTDSDTVRERIRKGEFEYSVYGVNYQTPDGENYFRAGSKVDEEGMEKARQRVESDFGMMDFLAEPIPSGAETERLLNRGMEQWRDIFTPRQLITHYEYLQAYQKHKHDIINKCSEQEAKVVLTLLSFTATRGLQHNNRLVPWYDAIGFGNDMFGDNNYSLKKMAGDNNLTGPRKSYSHTADHVIDSYDNICSLVDEDRSYLSKVTNNDAEDLSSQQGKSNIDVAVVDPPYYSSIMYAELSDVFYVLQKEYLGDTYPELFDSKLSNKGDEAVANPSNFEDLAEEDSSKKELADQYYEEKMSEIFCEVHSSLTDDGVMTVMFTHREMDAWDTLTSALIDAGFVITATHPVKTEMTDRIGMRESDSADSSILLTARKDNDKDTSSEQLWDTVRGEIYTTAEDAAREIIESEYNISKTDTAISAYGPTLKQFVEAYPVVDKKGNRIRPRKALSEARQAVTSVLVENYLQTDGVDELDPLTRWYVLVWLIHENDTLLYDEARQIGVAADVDVDTIKRPTKIWGKSSGDLQLKAPDDRVQDIVRVENPDAEDPSSRKYPVNPTDKHFTHVIDLVHAAIHVYEREGSDRALEWMMERSLKTNTAFDVTVTALLETLPASEGMHSTLSDMVIGQTGEYLDVDVAVFDDTTDGQQTEMSNY